MDGGPGTDLVATIGFYVVTGGLGLGVLAMINGIRKRWAARHTAGFNKGAFWWEAIVHAIAIAGFVMTALLVALLFLSRNGF